MTWLGSDVCLYLLIFFSSRRRHTICSRDWSSDVCSSDLLVCLGLYGSMTYSVARRTREIGVRMALGAPREGLIWMVTREARIELAIGGPIGIAAAVAATRVFEAMLFGLSKKIGRASCRE